MSMAKPFQPRKMRGARDSRTRRAKAALSFRQCASDQSSEGRRPASDGLSERVDSRVGGMRASQPASPFVVRSSDAGSVRGVQCGCGIVRGPSCRDLPMIRCLAAALLCGLSFNALAQDGADHDASAAPSRSPWGIGVAAVVSDSPYVGEGTRFIPIPLVSYEGERFYFRGITAGWRLVDTDSFEFALLGKARLDGFDVDDLDRAALARNGVDAALLEDRRKGLDLGVGMEWSGAAGELQLEMLADATDRSGGQEVSLQYGYPVRMGRGMVTPVLGATWWSDDMADYYYGPLRSEVARGVAAYAPGAVTVPHVGVSFFRPLGSTWSLVGSLRYSRLPDAISGSPFVDAGTDDTVSVFVGVSRGFRPWWMRKR